MMYFNRVTLLICAFFIFLSPTLWGQKTVITGKIFDNATKEDLPFVNLYFTDDPSVGTTSDVDGKFRLETFELNLESISISYLGYREKVVSIIPGQKQSYNISLEVEGEMLDEVVVKDKKKVKKDTAAIRIYRNVVKNREKNRLTGLDTYAYEEYVKSEFDLFNLGDNFEKSKLLRPFSHYISKTDTTEAGEKYLPFLIKETITDHFYRNDPEAKKEIIKADRISVVIDNKVTDLVNYVIDPIDVYDNTFRIHDRAFISPFAKGALFNYQYFLADSVVINDSKNYKLEFTGKRKQDLAFSGYAWIQDGSFAITDIELYILPQVDLNFINNFGLRQRFENIDGNWFKVDEEIFTNINLTKKKKHESFLVKKNISRKNIVLNKPIPKEQFRGEKEVFEKKARKKSVEYWAAHRHKDLTENEVEVINAIDSIKNTKAYRNLSWTSVALTTAFLRTGPIEWGRFYQFFSWNEIEGNRYKIGARTNLKLSEKYRFDGYLAYGTKDKRYKYGFGFLAHIPRKTNKWNLLTGTYKNDIIQLDQRDLLLTHDNLVLALLRTEPLSKLLNVEQANLYLDHEITKDLVATVGLSRQRFTAVSEELKFKTDVIEDGEPVEVPVEDIITSELNLKFVWARKSPFYQGRYTYYPLGFHKPVFYFDYRGGFKNILGSQYNFHRIEGQMRHRFDHLLGTTFYHLRGAKMFGSAPYPILKMHRGNESFIGRYWGFELMNEFEYISDAYASIMFRHNFNGLILNRIPLIKKLKWRSLIHFKAVAGTAQKKNLDLVKLPFQLSPLDGYYLEAGFGVSNIFKAYRVSFVWRLHPTTNELIETTKLFGVKISFHPSL